jgi:hypothetical protein
VKRAGLREATAEGAACVTSPVHSGGLEFSGDVWPNESASVPPTVEVKFAGARDAFLRWTGDAAVASVVPGGVMNVALTG